MKKSVASHYNRKRVGYSAVTVCSQTERKIFCKYFSYGVESVFVTGFPRYDSLLEKSKTATVDCNQVLFFPTWRPGLEKMTTEAVANHEFFVQWKLAMKSAGEIGLRRVLILHPMLYRHSSLFEDFVDEIHKATSFQDVLVQSSCLITDYSSVSFDALFLKKPVFLFQFDQESYGIRKDAFINVDTQLPGHPSLSVDALLESIRKAKIDQWSFDLDSQRNLYFDHGDDQNSARVLNLIRAISMTN
jgi:CDP-glycerol glycerophosphotransferase (TagB/SpsB family)